eukprot:Colp12_sorted_trinity150504_noHs@543
MSGRRCECGFVSASAQELAIHERRWHDPALAEYYCDACDVCFVEMQQLVLHAYREHDGHHLTLEPLVNNQSDHLTCRRCFQTFTSRSRLFNHLRTFGHFGPPENHPHPAQPAVAPSPPPEPVDDRLTCRCCGDTFGSRGELFRHLREWDHFMAPDGASIPEAVLEWNDVVNRMFSALTLQAEFDETDAADDEDPIHPGFSQPQIPSRPEDSATTGAYEEQEVAAQPPSKIETACVICFTSQFDTLVLPCKHLQMCYSCALKVKNGDNRCPSCRSEIEEMINRVIFG